MSQSGNALFFSVSGVRGSGRTTLYEKLKTVLPKELALPQCDFAFLGNPFGALPHPLLWSPDPQRGPVERLFACWVSLERFTNTKLKPALDAGKIVFTDGFGLDAALHAAAASETVQGDRDVLKWHLEILVPGRIKTQNITPPKYVITNASRADAEVDLRKSVPTLCPYAVHQFVERERFIIKSYFAPGTGQQAPQYLSAETSLEERVLSVTAMVREHLQLSIKSAA